MGVKTRSAVPALLLLLACLALAACESTFVGVSSRVTLPSDAYNVRVFGYGGGGGASLYYAPFDNYCAAGGGSSARFNTSAPSWAAGYSLDITIGQGGAPGTTLGGDGTPTVVVVKDASGNAVQTMIAYGGGGGSFVDGLCLGGAGGGAASSASGATPGAGTPPGGGSRLVSGPDGNYYVPQEGAIVGDIKAGGAGGYSGVGMTYPASGAAWSPYNAGGNSDYDYVSGCFCAGGAAGARGNGPSGACATGPVSVVPPVNSGAGGGTQTGCPSGLVAGTSAGADGGVVIEYSTGPQPSPSASPLPTASPLPSTLTVSLVWPANNGYLSAQSNGKVSASSTTPASWIATFSGGKWSLKSSFNKYLSVDNTGKVTASATAVTSAQQFDLSIASANQWTLKSSAHGTYLDSTSTGVVSATANAAAYWVRS